MKRKVKCKRCGARFLMEALIAHRLLAAKCENAPRCPKCELRAKLHTASVLRAYHLFSQGMARCPVSFRTR